MSFNRWRQHRLTRGLATVLALLVYGSALGGAHPGGDDPDCSPIVVVHDHAAHRIASQPTQSSAEDHCFICHSLRLLHAARAMRAARLAPPRAIGFSSRSEAVHLLRGHAAIASSRGPPAAHL